MKKLVNLLLLVCTVLCCAFGFSACDSGVKFQLHFVVEGEKYAAIDTSGQEIISIPADPEKEGYLFDGWFWDEGAWTRPFTASSLLNTPLSSNMAVYAKFSEETPAVIPVESVALDKTELTLEVEQTATLTASVLPENATSKAVVWASSNAAVVTVENGTVTAVAEGTVTITVTSEDGAKTASCTVTVKPKFIPVESVVLDKAELTLEVEQTATLTASVLPENATSKAVVWASSNAAVATVENGTITAVAEGTAMVTATSEDGAKTASCTVTVKPKFIPVESVVLDKAELTLDVEQTATLTASVLPENATSKVVVWVSSNAAVATVENGTITAVAEGTVTITATSEDGAKTASCTVSVSSPLAITLEGFTQKDGEYYTKVSNATQTFSFLDATKVANAAEYRVYRDIECNAEDEIFSKNPKLTKGDNSFYILVRYKNQMKIYPVVVRRRLNYSVRIQTLNGESDTVQTVEEDNYATAPVPSKTGYTFEGWDYDFATPITQNTTITAKWIANEYELTLDVNGGDSLAQSKQTVVFDEKYILPVPTRTGYTFLGWYNGEVQFAGADGALVTTVWKEAKNVTATAKWSINSYQITLAKNMDVGSVSGGGKYVYASERNVSASVNKLGYEFIGWYEGDTLLTEELTYSFTVTDRAQTFTAKFSISKEMELFDFTSTATTCKITGIKDKTVTELSISDYVTEIANGAFSGCSGLTSIEIPNSVTSIGNYAFSSCSGLTSIEIPNSVTSIGNAFSGCSGLTSMTIPFVGGSRKTATDTYQLPFGYIFGTSSYTGGKATTQYYYGSSTSSKTDSTYYIPSSLKSVTVTGGNILYGAFAYCSGLTSIEIPNSVTSIGASAFYNCSRIKSIEIPNSVTTIGASAFGNCSGLTSVHINDIAKWCAIDFENYASNPLYYAKNLYLNGTLVTELVIPDGVTTIGASAFGYCSGLTSIEIGNSVTSIGEDAFRGCSGLTSVVIGDSVTTIGASAFSGCSNLTSMTIPFVGGSRKTANNIYQYPFGYIFGTSSYTGGTAITQYYYGSSISSTTNSTYYIPSSLKSVTVTGGNILRGAFYNCSGLTSVVIGDSVTTIGNSAFYYCRGLTSIEIPDSVTTIGNSAFYNCSGLTSVVIGDSVTTIGNSAFYYCSGLTSIDIPNSVTLIGSSAFYNCIGLTSVEISNSVTSIGYEAFYKCSGLKSIEIPNSVTLIGDYAFRGCSGLTSIEIPNSVTTIGASAFGYCSGLTSIEIPNSVATIGQYAFALCSGLTSIEIPNSVTTIGNYAFRGCSGLTSIEIPNSVTTIGEYAFDDCSGLMSVVIGDSVTSIGEDAFYNCSNLTAVYINDIAKWCAIDFGYIANPLYYAKNLYLNGTLVTDLVIPDGVTSIGEWTFSYCSNLQKVYYNGTKSEWSTISIGDYNSYLTKATRYYYSETQPTDTANKYWHYVDGKIVEW